MDYAENMLKLKGLSRSRQRCIVFQNDLHYDKQLRLVMTWLQDEIKTGLNEKIKI